ALLNSLGREEGIENAVEMLGRDAGSAVAHTKADSSIFLRDAEMKVATAAPAHGVERIDAKIDEDLFELGWVGFDRDRVARQIQDWLAPGIAEAKAKNADG